MEATMPYGHISPEMLPEIAAVVRRKVVWDLGAGDLAHARTMLKLGAREVIAIEKEDTFDSPYRGIKQIHAYFHEVDAPDSIDVVLLSWPCNYSMRGVVRFLERAHTVIYLGSNTSGSACGDPRIWENLVEREVVAYVPTRRNVLLIYSQPPRTRDLVGEEIAALTGQFMDYDDAIGYGKKG